MYNRFRHAVPVAVVSVIALCFLAGCEECPEGAPAPQPHGDGALTGYVLDAISGYGVEGADVVVGDASDVTDEDGYFFVPDIVSGDVTVDVSADNYIDLEVDLEVAAGETLEHDFALVPVSEYDEWRFILSWGQDPADLDSHLWVPIGESSYYHVYYNNDGYLDQEPYAQLDIDDVTSYGPETITVRKHEISRVLSTDYYAGEYIYAVKHYSGDGSIPTSGAQVRIYHDNTLVRTINAPAGTAYDDWYWYVGRLNCRTGAWTLVNTYSATAPAALSGGVDTK